MQRRKSTGAVPPVQAVPCRAHKTRDDCLTCFRHRLARVPRGLLKTELCAHSRKDGQTVRSYTAANGLFLKVFVCVIACLLEEETGRISSVRLSAIVPR